MKRIYILSAIILLVSISAFAQQLPLNTCGIVNTYDASGNRLRRLYFCNNGIDPYPLRTNGPIVTSDAKGKGITQTNSQPPGLVNPKQPKINFEFQSVDALYPNPTTGKFSITFSKALNNAIISITDGNGKVILQFKANGYKIDVDLSSVAAGTYFVKINDAGNVISKKVVKM